jgi:hypothetical protein
MMASVATDRSIVLHDLRTSMPLTKTTLQFASNRVSWSPMEAFNLAVANEDHNVYIFDARNFSRALNILKGHVHVSSCCQNLVLSFVVSSCKFSGCHGRRMEPNRARTGYGLLRSHGYVEPPAPGLLQLYVLTYRSPDLQTRLWPFARR